ncbi:5760_t:CDS:10 [Funneliformis geosporum]|uniref:non-specific serine/threonine protein kinase n=1 Tax=Funneliformis geosporum TaxID=1117311 RepID=A0A9W4WRA9_9GLOM|nr:5760_t:CDS:10 [Funneliformis geosporum]CAI2166254.1 2954_t:CDS:10 [Funneliformis geosporum]
MLEVKNLTLESGVEQYQIIRSCSYGRNFNVYKAYETNKPKVHYVIKYYNTRDVFERESKMLSELLNAENIMQMITFSPSRAIVVCECGLYDLETFLSHQDYNQRHEEKCGIIKDVVSGILELNKHKIVHNEITPQNIMYFQEKDGERWKLIDFDEACFVGSSNYVNLITNYSAPEVIKAYDKKIEIIANFAIDMFSFGLVLYYLETGQHYWNRENDDEKNEIISAKYLPLSNIRDNSACYAIRKLLDKNISRRMSLEEFMSDKRNSEISIRSSICLGERLLEEPTNIVNNKYNVYDNISQAGFEVQPGISEAEFQAKLAQRTFQIFLEKYHNEMKQSLKILNDKIDNCTKAVEDLSELTKKIPQWLAQLKNEKVPRVFVMVPDRKDWKKPMTWLFSKPFRLLFVCEHKKRWHIPEQEGYKVVEVPQFIKKYGPWINLCLKTLSCAIGVMTLNAFPQVVTDILSSIFNITESSDVMKYFQEIIDTIDIGVKTMTDENPDFIPLNQEEVHIPHQMINASGLHMLKKFLDTQESADHFGGLVQCVDEETQEILWICKEHRNGYCVRPNEQPEMAPAPPNSGLSQLKLNLQPKHRNYPPNISTLNMTPNSSPTRSPRIKQTPTSLPISPSLTLLSPSETSPTETIFVPPEGDYSKYYTKDSTDPLDPYYALEHAYQILCDVIANTVSSGRKHFKNDEVKAIAQKMYRHKNRIKDLCPNWGDSAQKVQFINIIKEQVHLYIYFLRSIVRYCVVHSVRKKMKYLFNDTIDIRHILKAGKSFNNLLGKLISCLEASQDDIHNVSIQVELDYFVKEMKLNINIDGFNIINERALTQWYHTVDRTCIENLESPSEVIVKGVLFNSTRRLLDNWIVTGRSLKYLDHAVNLSCIEKEICLYNEHKLNNIDYIIKFGGYSIHNCTPTLFYEFANFGDLFSYFQGNQTDLLNNWEEKIKLSLDITQGVRSLHRQGILHLDLRSANILLQYDETEKMLIPKISNFLWSKNLHSRKKTLAYPKITIPLDEMVWKRWYDPDRLLNEDDFESLLPSSDIYSLGLLFWEIAWSKAGNLPFKDISIDKLYDHLRSNNKEKLPEISEEYRSWGHLIERMWQNKSEHNCNIHAVEKTLIKLFKCRNNSFSSNEIMSPMSPIQIYQRSNFNY